MEDSEEPVEDKLNVKIEIKQECDILPNIPPETAFIKVKPWTIDLNKIKSDPETLDLESETIRYATNNEPSSISKGFQIKTDDENGSAPEFKRIAEGDGVEIKPEKYFVDNSIQNFKEESIDSVNECTHMNCFTNYLNVNKQVEPIHGSAIENLYSIKCEDVEIKSEGNYSDISLPNLIDEPVACKSECQSKYATTTTNISLLKGKRRQRGPEDRPFSDEQIYKCNICDYKTMIKSCFTEHQLKHENVLKEQIYECDSCNFKTVYKRSLINHQLRHTDIPEEKMYECDLCSYKSVCKRYLTRHQGRHKNIPDWQILKCNVCDYRTIYKSAFRNHQLQHKNIPDKYMYKCASCDYMTLTRYNLTRHQRKHKDIPRVGA